jgi:hypothetical protein
MHDRAALLQVRQRLVVVACVDVKYASIEIVVFFVEDVLLIVISFICFLCVSVIIRNVGTLGRVGTRL